MSPESVLRHLGLDTQLHVETPAHVYELAQTWLTLRQAKDYVEGGVGRR